MKSFLNALLFCVIVIMLASCKKDNPVDSSSDVKQIWPLQLGNTWAFNLIAYDTAGTVISSGSGSFRVTADTNVAGEKWYRIAGTGSDGGMFYTNRVDGFWGMVKSRDGLSTGLLFKHPVRTGDNWNFGDESVSLQSVDTSITVPAGTYHCIKYRFSMGDYYFCPGVGIIAEDYFSRTNSGRMYLESRLSVTSVTLK